MSMPLEMRLAMLGHLVYDNDAPTALAAIEAMDEATAKSILMIAAAQIANSFDRREAERNE
jgi:hypothetical protein